jgi:single-stranded-DNA-specific exonuclease
MRTPEIEIDAEINFSDITPKLIRILKQFEPFGPQNMTPVFMSSNVKDTGYAKTLGADDEHLRLFVKQNNSDGIAAIGFGLGKKIEITKNQNTFQLAYSLAENEWNDTVSTQLMLKDIRTNED